MSSIYLANSSTNIIPIVAIIVIVAIVAFCAIMYIKGLEKSKANRAYCLEQLTDLFNRHNKLSIGMSEQEMLNIMSFRFDKNLSEDCTTYRFVFIPKGGSSSYSGSVYGSMNNGSGFVSGASSGSSENHDESVVIVECKDNKVTKVSPYNMSNVQFPANLRELIALTNSCGISLPT